MAQQLARAGCAKVHVAHHGLDALEFLSKTTFFNSATQQNPIPLSLILLDVEMPVMDGLTAARRIREMEDRGEIARHVPIIAITANARKEQITAALEAGMDDVQTKPFRIPDIVPRMVNLVGQWAVETG